MALDVVLAVLANLGLAGVPAPGLEIPVFSGGSAAQGKSSWFTVFLASMVNDRAVFEWTVGRALVASLVGAGLGGAGAALQRYLNNDLADPFVLGISGAALFGAVCVTLLVPAAWLLALAPTGVLLVSLAGAAGAGALVLGVLVWGRHRLYRNVAGLILLGVIVNAFCSAATMLVMALDHPLYPQIDYGLLVGRIEAYDAHEIALLALLVGAGLGLMWRVRRHIEWAPYGGPLVPFPRGFRSFGLRPETLCFVGVALVACTGAAYAGAIGFVGLMAPHLARAVSRRFAAEFWLSALFGGLGLFAADLFSQRVAWPRVLPVGVATALLGSLGMAWMLRHRMRGLPPAGNGP